VAQDGPDIAAGWDRLADAYQREIGWPDDQLSWGFRCPPEHELRLVSDVAAGADTLVIGCGGGQDLVALARLGAGSLVGIDPSSTQLEHAAARLDEAGVDARLELGTAEALTGVADASVDVAVSVQALNYVADLTAAVAELRRVLRPGGIVAISVMHPADMSTKDRAPYGWHTSWFEVERDWEWDGLADEAIAFRSWFRSPSQWFTALTEGGLVVDRLLEPAPVDDPSWIDRGWLDADTYAKLDVVPSTIIVRAHQPEAS
jgi:ubiquinone/menaquinone biosynthesis C-methylase UbiE